jgi:Universal stress protein UspA and related nucleotide-binding proteins
VIRGTNKPVLLIRAGTPLPAREIGILNKLLVPLDGSKESAVIVPYVEELISKVIAEPKPEVTLLQVIAATHYIAAGEAVTNVPYTKAEIEQLKAETKSYLEKAGSELKGKGVSTKFEVAVGNAAEEIISFADKINANLTAMSTHGHSGFSHLSLGSVADRVLRHGNTPLLLVRPAGA